MSTVPVVASAEDLEGAIRYADRNPKSRWYVSRRAAALGAPDAVPESWGLTAASVGRVVREAADAIGAAWDAALHPRGRDGQFIEKGGTVNVFDGAGYSKPSGRGVAVGVKKDASGRELVSVKLEGGKTVEVESKNLDSAPATKARLDGGSADSHLRDLGSDAEHPDGGPSSRSTAEILELAELSPDKLSVDELQEAVDELSGDRKKKALYARTKTLLKRRRAMERSDAPSGPPTDSPGGRFPEGLPQSDEGPMGEAEFLADTKRQLAREAETPEAQQGVVDAISQAFDEQEPLSEDEAVEVADAIADTLDPNLDREAIRQVARDVYNSRESGPFEDDYAVGPVGPDVPEPSTPDAFEEEASAYDAANYEDIQSDWRPGDPDPDNDLDYAKAMLSEAQGYQEMNLEDDEDPNLDPDLQARMDALAEAVRSGDPQAAGDAADAMSGYLQDGYADMNDGDLPYRPDGPRESSSPAPRKVNPNNPDHEYLSDEALSSLQRSGVSQDRIDAMRATRDKTDWVDDPSGPDEKSGADRLAEIADRAGFEPPPSKPAPAVDENPFADSDYLDYDESTGTKLKARPNLEDLRDPGWLFDGGGNPDTRIEELRNMLDSGTDPTENDGEFDPRDVSAYGDMLNTSEALGYDDPTDYLDDIQALDSLGSAVGDQLGNIVNGDALEDQNSNALSLIADRLGGSRNEELRGLAESIQEYLDKGDLGEKRNANLESRADAADERLKRLGPGFASAVWGLANDHTGNREDGGAAAIAWAEKAADVADAVEDAGLESEFHGPLSEYAANIMRTNPAAIEDGSLTKRVQELVARAKGEPDRFGDTPNYAATGPDDARTKSRAEDFSSGELRVFPVTNPNDANFGHYEVWTTNEDGSKNGGRGVFPDEATAKAFAGDSNFLTRQKNGTDASIASLTDDELLEHAQRLAAELGDGQYYADGRDGLAPVRMQGLFAEAGRRGINLRQKLDGVDTQDESTAAFKTGDRVTSFDGGKGTISKVPDEGSTPTAGASEHTATLKKHLGAIAGNKGLASNDEIESLIGQIEDTSDPKIAQARLAVMMTQLKLGGKQRKRYREILDAHYASQPAPGTEGRDPVAGQRITMYDTFGEHTGTVINSASGASVLDEKDGKVYGPIKGNTWTLEPDVPSKKPTPGSEFSVGDTVVYNGVRAKVVGVGSDGKYTVEWDSGYSTPKREVVLGKSLFPRTDPDKKPEPDVVSKKPEPLTPTGVDYAAIADEVFDSRTLNAGNVAAALKKAGLTKSSVDTIDLSSFSSKYRTSGKATEIRNPAGEVIGYTQTGKVGYDEIGRTNVRTGRWVAERSGVLALGPDKRPIKPTGGAMIPRNQAEAVRELLLKQAGSAPSKPAPDVTGAKKINRVDAAEQMYGTDSPQHREAKRRWPDGGPETQDLSPSVPDPAETEPVDKRRDYNDAFQDLAESLREQGSDYDPGDLMRDRLDGVLRDLDDPDTKYVTVKPPSGSEISITKQDARLMLDQMGVEHSKTKQPDVPAPTPPAPDRPAPDPAKVEMRKKIAGGDQTALADAIDAGAKVRPMSPGSKRVTVDVDGETYSFDLAPNNGGWWGQYVSGMGGTRSNNFGKLNNKRLIAALDAAQGGSAPSGPKAERPAAPKGTRRAPLQMADPEAQALENENYHAELQAALDNPDDPALQTAARVLGRTVKGGHSWPEEYMAAMRRTEGVEPGKKFYGVGGDVDRTAAAMREWAYSDLGVPRPKTSAPSGPAAPSSKIDPAEAAAKFEELDLGGFGYSNGRRRLGRANQEAADAFVLQQAAERGWDDKKLADWTDSRVGRHFADAAEAGPAELEKTVGWGMFDDEAFIDIDPMEVPADELTSEIARLRALGKGRTGYQRDRLAQLVKENSRRKIAGQA